MTVTRRITITYDGLTPEEAAAFEGALVEYVCTGLIHTGGVENLSWATEPVIPSPEPLVEPGD